MLGFGTGKCVEYFKLSIATQELVEIMVERDEARSLQLLKALREEIMSQHIKKICICLVFASIR